MQLMWDVLLDSILKVREVRDHKFNSCFLRISKQDPTVYDWSFHWDGVFLKSNEKVQW